MYLQICAFEFKMTQLVHVRSRSQTIPEYASLHPGLFAKLSKLYATYPRSLDAAQKQPVAIPLGILSPSCLLMLPPNISRSSLGPLVSDWGAIAEDDLKRNFSSAVNRALDQFDALIDSYTRICDTIGHVHTSASTLPTSVAMLPRSVPAAGPEAGDCSPAPHRLFPEPITPEDSNEGVYDGANIGGIEGGRLKLTDALANVRSRKEYAYIHKPNDCKGLRTGTTIVHLFTTGWERGAVQPMSKNETKNAAAKGFTLQIRYVNGDRFLHDLSSESCEYITKETFEDLLCGNVKEEDSGVAPGAWCIVKLK